MDRMRSINGIFEKGVGQDYTDDALMCQDILKYCLITKKEPGHRGSVKIYELLNWLLRNNWELLSYYTNDTKRHTRYSVRVHVHRTRIENKVNDLIALRLMERSGTIKGEKNNLETPLYSYIKLGYLLALIMKGSLLDKEIGIEKRKQTIDKTKIIDKQKEQQSVSSEIFNLLDSTFFKIEENSASTAIFYSHFFTKCKEKGIFDILVTHIADILHSNHHIEDMQALLEHAMDLGLADKKSREVFMDLWNETFEDLNENTRSLVLFQMKLNAERRFEDTKGFLTKEYEETRFKNGDDYERIVVEGECEKCGIGTVALPYLEYRKRFAHVGPRNPILFGCPRCGTINGLSILGLNT